MNCNRLYIMQNFTYACMHRDMQSNTPLRFYEFASHLEILNAGGLYGNARPENFPSVNDYRNPLIASAMKTMGYVNMFNRGVGQVQADLKENGNPPAEFNVNLITAFKVDVKVAQNYVTDNGGNVGGKNGGKAGVDTVAEKLTERQKDILAILRDVAVNVAVNVSVNTKYLSERMHVNRKTIQRDIVGLQEQNLVQWVGSDKNGHWEIINPET